MMEIVECTGCGRLDADAETCPDCGAETEAAHYSPSTGQHGVGRDTVSRVSELVLGGDHVDRIRKNHTRVVEVEYDREVDPEDVEQVAEAFAGMNLDTKHPEDGRFSDGVNPYCLHVIRKHHLSE